MYTLSKHPCWGDDNFVVGVFRAVPRDALNMLKAALNREYLGLSLLYYGVRQETECLFFVEKVI